MAKRQYIAVLACVALSQSAMAQRPWTAKPGPSPALPAEADRLPLSDAERIARLQRGIDETQAQLSALREKLDDPKSEFKKAEAEFSELDAQLEDGRKALHKAKSEESLEAQETRERALAEVQNKRALARERFDLAIRERKGLQDQIILLEQKIQQDRDALNKLAGTEAPKPPVATSEGKDGSTAPSPTSAATPDASGKPSSAVVTESGLPPASPAAKPSPDDLGTLINPLQPPAAAAPLPEANIPPKAPPSEKIIKAEETATSKHAEAQEAKQQAQSITERLDSIRKVIENEKGLRTTARQKADNASKTLRALEAEHEKKLAEGTPWSQLKELRSQINDAESRLNEVDTEIRERAETLDTRHTELVSLQAEQIVALEQAKKKMEEAQAAQAELEHLKNPFAPANIWQWIIVHAPKITATIVGAIVLLWLIQIMEHRMVRLLTRHGVGGSPEDRESRARTLVGVLQNAFTVIVVAGALLIVVAESGFNITALLGATAVIGLAVAFGAQNLIRDYFYGFMILMENQYLVNDVVRLGSISGQVERITLRITVLRDLRGTVHFVPHGQITTVSNLTRGWARVVLDVGVAYKEDVDRVMKVLADLGKEIRRDPAYRDLILDEPEISGVDALGDSAVVVRFLIKTRPLQQWQVKREMLRRIKNKFDEVGIEIPFPQQVVYNRFEPGAQGQAHLIDPAPHDEDVSWPTPHSAAG